MSLHFARILELIEWDGALPLVLATGPIVVKTMFPNPPVMVGLYLVLAPPVAALIRAHIGWGQIAKRCNGRVPILRQVAMAVAIVLLFIFETAVTVLTFDAKIPAEAWWIPVGVYAGYLVVVSYALRPVPKDLGPLVESHVPFERSESTTATGDLIDSR